MPPEISSAQDGLFKAIAGHGIRKVLRFQAQRAARRIYCALLAAAFGQEICGVELHARSVVRTVMVMPDASPRSTAAVSPVRQKL